MGAVLLLVMVAVMTLNLVFTVLIWKERKLGANEMVVPRGIPREAVPDVASGVDMSQLVASTVEAMNRNAEESGEEETQISEDDIQKAMKALQGMKL